VLELDGYNVTAVSTLSAADRAIARELPALVVLDLNLPDGDGLDLARKLKRDGERPAARSSPAPPAR
jgi:DNA-binding response OmpR family regulator